MKVPRVCECCFAEFEWENECRCGKNKHAPVCSTCSSTLSAAKAENMKRVLADGIYEKIDDEILAKFNAGSLS